PQVACEPSTRVQVGVGWAPPSAVLPWHFVVQVVPFHAAPGPAIIAKITSALPSPSMCPGASTVAGTTWQSEHATGRCQGDSTERCTRCAPTGTEVVSVAPDMLLGGALLVSSPWQPSEQPSCGSTLGGGMVSSSPGVTLPMHPVSVATRIATRA